MSHSYGTVRQFELRQGYNSSSSNGYKRVNPSLSGRSMDIDEANEPVYDWDESERRLYGRGAFLIFLIIVSVLGSIAYFHLDDKIVTTLSDTASEFSDSAASLFSLGGATDDKPIKISAIVSNEYGEFSAPYPWLSDGSKLIEPYKVTNIMLDGYLEGLYETGNYQFTWTITSDFDADHIYTSDVPKTVIKLKIPGKYFLTVLATAIDSGSSSVIYKTKLYCKYVRRELRTLTKTDRERFLDASSMIWKHDTITGKAKYGLTYTGIQTFVEEHAMASNDIRCDTFHEGSGFLTHHLALSNSFEAALRAVNPAVTLHYWDFTIEGQQIVDAGETPSYFLKVTPFLTDEWFGSVDDKDHIQDSRWAHTKMPKADDDSIVAPNSFGYIRSYWNNNNAPEVTRHLFDVCGFEAVNKVIPNCASHYDLLNTDNLAEFQTLSPGEGHGPLHVHLGGIGGECGPAMEELMERWHDLLHENITTSQLIAAGVDMNAWAYGETHQRLKIFQTNILGEYFHFYRFLWRSHMCSRDNTPNLLVCPATCTDGQTVDDCKCEVTSLVEGTTDYQNVFACIAGSYSKDLFAQLFPAAFIEDLTRTVSTTSLYEGDMVESASPVDPVFWVIHTTIERLLMAKRLHNFNTMGSQSFQKWESPDGADETWLSYSYYTQGEGVNKYFKDAYVCEGHAANDAVLPRKLPFTAGFKDLADKDGDGIITNWEYFVAINPNNPDGLDYVYDNFKWEHC